MTGRHVGFVLIALILLGVAALAARLVTTEAQVPILSGVRPLAPDVIDKVVMRNDQFETILEKREGGEWWAGPYPVLDLRMKDLWQVAGKIDGAELTSNNPLNHALMGVSHKNATTLQFWRGDELQAEFLVGDQSYAPLIEEEKPIQPWSAYVRRCFVRPPDRDEVYGLFCPFPDIFGPDTDRWPERRLAEIPREEVEVLTFTYPDEEFDLRVDRSVWVVVSPIGAEPADLNVVQDYLQLLEFGQIFGSLLTPAEMEGLDFSEPDARLGVGAKAGAATKSVLLLFLEQPAVTERGEEELPAYYVKDAEKPYAYLLSGERASQVLKRRHDFFQSTPLPTRTPRPAPAPEPTPAAPEAEAPTVTPTPTPTS